MRPTYFTYSAATGKKTVDPLKRNQFGGTVGGPLEIPHVFHTNKAFGFFGYQRTINHGAAAFHDTVPADDCARQVRTRQVARQEPTTWCLQIAPHDPLMPSAILAPTITCGAGTSNVWSSSALSPVTVNRWNISRR